MSEFNELEIGDPVIDSDNNHGVITAIYDIHNVEVKFLNGEGIYCLDSNCPEYSPLHYDLSGL